MYRPATPRQQCPHMCYISSREANRLMQLLCVCTVVDIMLSTIDALSTYSSTTDLSGRQPSPAKGAKKTYKKHSSALCFPVRIEISLFDILRYYLTYRGGGGGA